MKLNYYRLLRFLLFIIVIYTIIFCIVIILNIKTINPTTPQQSLYSNKLNQPTLVVPTKIPIIEKQYTLGYINEPRHHNSNQCYEKSDIKLSSYYNNPTEDRPVPTMGPNYSDEKISDNCSCLEGIHPP